MACHPDWHLCQLTPFSFSSLRSRRYYQIPVLSVVHLLTNGHLPQYSRLLTRISRCHLYLTNLMELVYHILTQFVLYLDLESGT